MTSYEDESDEILMMIGSGNNSKWSGNSSKPQPISNKNNKQHRISTDSGYESILLSSSHSTSFMSTRSSLESAGDSRLSSEDISSSSSTSPTTPLLLLSTTPVKMMSITTPTKSNKITADMNALYLASIRSQSQASSQQFLSPVKNASSSSCSSSSSCHFNQYSLSNSNSPLIYSGKKCSPKFTAAAVDSSPFINERSTDYSNISKLLKSPASRFSPYSKNSATAVAQNSFKVRTFSARLRSEGFGNDEATTGPMATIEDENAVKSRNHHTTPTEEQFLEMLYRNRHIPSDPYTLIGRHMGLDKVDIINELRDRSMHTIVDKILSYLSLGDLVRVSGVSRVWREAVRENKRLKRERSAFVRRMRDRFHVTKENRSRTSSLLSSQQQQQVDMTMNNTISPAIMKNSRFRRSSLLNVDLNSSSLNLNNSSSNVVDVDMLAVNNTSYFKPIDLNRLGPNGERNDLNNITNSTLLQQRQPSNLGAELLQAAGSLCLNTTCKSIASTTAINLSDLCQKVSPKKSAVRISESPPRTTKFDAIGSKKSKKNLKRL